MKKIKVITFVVSFTAALALQAGPAYAEDASISLISELTPGLLEETNASNQFQVTRDEDSISIDSSKSTNQLLADLPSVSISADSQSIVYQQGLIIVSDGEAQTSSVIQPTSTGGRILTVINSTESSHCSRFTFDVPQGTTLELASEGFYLEHGSDVLLHISDAWALDAAGNSVATEYNWKSGTLTQCVNNNSSETQYPILADPGWDYTYQYNLNKTAATNKIHLKSCFNCYFPVDGAPQGFPVPNQLLPLSSTFVFLHFNMECRFNAEFNGTNSFGFSFLATAKHVDGIGSWILFDLKTVSGVKKLVVSAHVMNDSLKFGPYQSGAQAKWQDFANNLNQ